MKKINGNYYYMAEGRRVLWLGPRNKFMARPSFSVPEEILLELGLASDAE